MGLYDRQIAELDEQFKAVMARAGELRGKINEIAVTVTAPRQVVRVTVGAQGEVRAVEFPTSAYKRMAPAELAGTLMSAINEAKDKALAEYGELMQPEMPPGLNVLDLVQGKADWEALRSGELMMPDAVREYLEHGRAAGRDGVQHG